VGRTHHNRYKGLNHPVYHIYRTCWAG